MKGWKRGGGLKREAKMEKKSGNGTKCKREREKGREGEKMGPVVVEMSATGAAEMESDG